MKLSDNAHVARARIGWGKKEGGGDGTAPRNERRNGEQTIGRSIQMRNLTYSFLPIILLLVSRVRQTVNVGTECHDAAA